MTVKPSTYNNYKRLLIDHIFADIGNKKYTALDKQYINDYVTSLIDSGRKDGKGSLSVSMTRDIINGLVFSRGNYSDIKRFRLRLCKRN